MLFYSVTILVAAGGLAVSKATRDINSLLSSFPGWGL